MRISDWSSDVCSSDLSRGSKTSSGNRTSPFRIIAHMPLRKAAVMACSSPCETAASTTATSLSRPGKSTAGETEAFIAAILARPAVRGGGRAKPGLCQEIGDGGAEAVEIDQERVVALRRSEEHTSD